MKWFFFPSSPVNFSGTILDRNKQYKKKLDIEIYKITLEHPDKYEQLMDVHRKWRPNIDKNIEEYKKGVPSPRIPREFPRKSPALDGFKKNLVQSLTSIKIWCTMGKTRH